MKKIILLASVMMGVMIASYAQEPQTTDKPAPVEKKKGEKGKMKPKDGEAHKGEMPKDGKGPKGEKPKDGEAPKGEKPKDGEHKGMKGGKKGPKPTEKPKEGEAPKANE